jgi:hypothetical protein
MADTLPGILSTGLTNLIHAVSKGLKRVKDPYALGVEPDPLVKKPPADTYQDQVPEHQIQYQPDYLTANMLLMLQLPEETNHC